MRINYFPSTDIVVLEFTDQRVHKSREIARDTHLDRDANGAEREGLS